MMSGILRVFLRIFFPFVLVLAGCWSPVCFAIDYPTKPTTDYYVDDANLMSADARSEINKILGRLNTDKKVVMYVVTIPSFAAEKAPDTSIENYTLGLAEHWGLGAPEDKYMVLLVISRDDRFARFQLGTGWPVSYGAKTQKILDVDVIPEFRKGDFSAGLVNAAQQIDSMVRDATLDLPIEPVSAGHRSLVIFGALVAILIFFGVMVFCLKRGRSKVLATDAASERKHFPTKKHNKKRN